MLRAVSSAPQRVMAGLVPAIHDLLEERKTWMPGTRPGMTSQQMPPGLLPAQLHLARPAVLARPFEASVIQFARGVTGEISVFERAARHCAHVGAAGRYDGVDVAVADDAADRHGRDVELVADLVAERRL